MTPEQQRRERNRGFTAGLFALVLFTLLWVAAWEVFTDGIPTRAIVWWLAAWGVLALLGHPTSKGGGR
jgi:membrane-bound metal-dependent hydrolase YbcI (DUF457 family)